MMKLTVYPPAFDEPSGSPFCVKAMAMLHHCGLDWEVDFQGDARKAPHAKFPVLHADDKVIPDSDRIRDYLETVHGVDFEAGLDKAQRATSRSFIRMVEEHLYFAIVSERWIEDECWPIIRETFFGALPYPAKWIVPGVARRAMIGQTKAQGLGRHSRYERENRAIKDIDAIADYLADNRFMFADKPTAVEFSVVPMLTSVISLPGSSRLGNRVREDRTLMDYVARVKETVYPAIKG